MRLTKFGLASLALSAVICVGQDAPQSTPNHQDAPPPAQQPADASESTDGNKTPDKKSDGAEATSKDRLFFALPNFLTLENGSQAIPLTSGEKFKVVAKGAFDYTQIPWYALVGAIGQAENSEPGYGQGWAAYGKRVGSSAADGTIENFMTGAIFPSILHQDPRYFQMGKGKLWNRITYSASRILITRSDSGHKQFNFSEVFGSALSAGISTYSYHPRSDRSVADVADVWGSQMGTDAITIMLKEFWPDIRNKILKKKTAN